MHALGLAIEGARRSKHIRDLRLYRRVKTASPLALGSYIGKCTFFDLLVLIDFLKLFRVGFRIFLGHAGRDAVILSFADRNWFFKRKIFASRSYTLQLQRIISRPRFQARARDCVPDFAL